MNDLLFTWNLLTSKKCPWCQLDDDSVTHLVRDCWVFGIHRIKLIEKIGFLPLQIGDLLQNRKHITALDTYLEDVELLKQKLLTQDLNSRP